MDIPFLTVQGSRDGGADPYQAIAPLLAREDLAFALLFAAPGLLDPALLPPVAAAGPRLFGCSTTGEISPAGYRSDTAVCIGFPRRHFSVVARRIEGLREFGFARGRELVLSALWELRERVPRADARNTFALLLIDSTSQSEEFVTAAIGSQLGNIVMLGGSAGDNWALRRAPVLDEGALHDDAALLLLVHSGLEFRTRNFHHYEPTAVRGVITAASPARRLVHEINGVPAIREYARLCGLHGEDIDLRELSARPVILLIGDQGYARGFSQVLEDGSMRFACAIDEGMVFRIAQPGDLVGQLAARLDGLRAELGPLGLVLAFECAARRMEVERAGLAPVVGAQFAAANVWGMSCMGEQANALHMNNSFTCIAFAAGA